MSYGNRGEGRRKDMAGEKKKHQQTLKSNSQVVSLQSAEREDEKQNNSLQKRKKDDLGETNIKYQRDDPH